MQAALVFHKKINAAMAIIEKVSLINFSDGGDQFMEYAR